MNPGDITGNMRTWAEIDLDAITGNFAAARRRLPDGMKLLAVIKADAYGHGAAEIARELEPYADFFAVAAADEAAELRLSGIKTPILILGYLPHGDYPFAVEYDIRLTVFTYEDAKILSECAAKCGKKAKVHIAADTGMGRIGVPCNDEGISTAKRIASLPWIECEGLFSHFASADEDDCEYSDMQMKRFDSFAAALTEETEIPILHLYNSAAIWKFGPKYDMARLGILLYGLRPSEQTEPDRGEIRQAMTLKTRVAYVKTINPGDSVSYGHTYTAERQVRVATLCAGYADGVPRQISGKGSVMIHGVKAPLIGRVCMDQMMADVSGIPECKAGDEAVIFGYDGDSFISADSVAELADTIGYTVVCGISKRVPRVYLRGGNVCKVSYGIPHMPDGAFDEKNKK